MTTQELKNKIEKVLGNSIRCLLPSYWWKNLFHSVADSIEEVSTSVSKLSKELSDLDNYVDITRDELYKLVLKEKLIPGRSYRIIDYECTLRPGINAYAYKNEEFAIIVKALSNWELDQNAKATFKPGTWSSRSRYASWQLKYSIYNDVNKYPWAAHGTLEYDASVVLDNPPYSWDDEMVVIWDSTENKYVLNTYVDDDGYRGYYLVTSETDKTPLAQTSFNYGDVVYVYMYGKDVYPAKISYTKAMRDSGDAVLVNYMYRTGVDYVRVFKWDINENAYVSVVNTSWKLKDSEGNILSKRESFTKPEKMMKHIDEDLATFGFYTPNGKGVIYYLKDSNNNEAYYDYKNIAFLFPEVSSEPVFTFDWDNREESESSYVKNVKIENAGDLNYISFNVDPNKNRGGLDNVVVSSKVKNQYFNSVYKNTYIGYDDNNNLAAVNIFNIGEAREEIIIDSELSYNSTNPVENKAIANKFSEVQEIMFYMTSSGGYTALVKDTSSFKVDFGCNYVINTASAGDIVITEFNALVLPADTEYSYLTYNQKSTIMFKGATSLTLPEEVIWANGVQPDIDPSLEYELSIVRTIIADTITYKAVLTPFYLP